jgi:hypothetical protein
MRNSKLTNKKNRSPLFPFLWPWKGKDNVNLTFLEILKSRKFTFFYLTIIWSLIAILDFGSTRDCGPTWQLAFICEQSVWLSKMFQTPFLFMLSSFTATLFHNGLDHILFVTIMVFLVMQNFEARNGTLATIFIFFSAMLFVAILMGFVINWGYSNWPDIEFYSLGIKRSWMGGSAGAFGVFGALSHNSRKPWGIFIIIGIFETLNLIFYGINFQISVGHYLSLVYGFTVWGLWIRKKKKKQFSRV